MESQKDNHHQGLSLKNGPKESPLGPKLEKLVTAIFMVTDLMDKAEPLRTELRTLSLGLISGSEASSGSRSFASLIPQLMSLINIATSINLISDMNGGILNKELSNMKDSIPTLESLNFDVLYKTPSLSLNRNLASSIQPRTVLKEVQRTVLKNPNDSKNDRRNNIIKVIKEKKEANVRDIALALRSLGEDRGEKTIQRELISLLKDNMIKKTGEKRWSKYFLN